MLKKIEEARKILKETKADAMFIMSPQNRFWVTGFNSSAGLLIIKGEGKVDFLLDGRYIEKAKAIFKNLNIIPYNLSEYFKKNKKIKKVALEEEYTILQTVKHFENFGLKILPFSSVDMRNVKSTSEIECVQKAIDISIKAFNQIKGKIVPGLTEDFVGKLLTKTMLDLGAEKNSFDPIVASGENGAYPHHQTSSKKIKDGEFVTIDFGCVYKGYCSDITRTILIGKKPIGKALEVAKYYQIVKTAQQLAIDSIKEGKTGKEIDEIARNYIKEKGYTFNHGTGHGLGIDVHEKPNVSPREEKILKAGNIITVEPGIYVPGIGGVRIEDDILVQKNGCINLSKKLEKI